MKPGPGVDAGLLADSIGPWSLLQGLGIQGRWCPVTPLKVWFLTELDIRSGCPELGLLMGRAVVQLEFRSGSGLLGQAGPIGCWIIVFLKLVSVPGLVRLLQRLKQASWS